MNYLQLPDHLYKEKLTALEMLIYSDVWTMQQIGKPYYKSNGTVSRQFAHDRRSVIRAVRRLESRGFLQSHQTESGRYLEALIPVAGSDPAVTGDTAVTSDTNGRGGDPAVTGGVTQMVVSSDPAVTQVENKREEEKKRKERRAKPRDLDEVIRVFREAGHEDLAIRFYDHWESRGWKVQPGMRLSDWMAAARNFIDNEKRNSEARRNASGSSAGSRGAVPWRDAVHERIKRRYTGTEE